MKLAIGHYHLNRGGVTRVIENQLLALDRVLNERESHDVLVVYGGRSEGWPADLGDRLQRIRLRLHALPALDYDSERSPGTLESQIVEVLERAGFAPHETIVHIHNHAIGKNATLPGAVWSLADRGYGLLLQIHDFAEDQRPQNFRTLARAGGEEPIWHGRLYPQAPHVHYAVLNGRDRTILQSVDVPAERLHFLPNPVLPFQELPDRETARGKLNDLFSVPPEARFVLYPVRGIRRKNLGEAMLHSLLAPEGTCVGLTLPPLNPAEWTRYEQWKDSARRWQLPFRFDVGAPGGLSFAENLAASDAILTTSIAEGFGMVYLESWLAGRSLMGRDLPEITQDFADAGLDLTRLRPRLDIPSDWLDLARLRETLLEAYRATIAAYDRPEPSDLREQVDTKLRADTIDFGDLDESFQVAVLGRVVTDPSARRDLLTLNPWIESSTPEEKGGEPILGDQPAGGAPCSEMRRPHRFSGEAELVCANADVVRGQFSLEPSGLRLGAVYDSIVNSPRGQEIQPLALPDGILDRFLNLARFRLLRS